MALVNRPVNTDTDVYSIERDPQPGGGWLVTIRHYQTPESKHTCCLAEDILQPGDDEFAFMSHMGRLIERNHGVGTEKPTRKKA